MGQSDLPKEIYEIIQQVAHNANIFDFEICVAGGTLKGQGYLGDTMFATIKNKNSENCKQIFLKRAFSSDKLRSLVPIRRAFLKEIEFYTITWPTLKKFQEHRNIPNNFLKIPELLSSSNRDGEEMIVLEDTKVQGFEVASKTFWDEKHLQLVFHEFGRFHALSFAYKDQYPEEYRQMEKNITNLWLQQIYVKALKGGLNGICNIAASALIKGKDGNIIEEYQKYIDNAANMFKKIAKYEGGHSIILHGDSWSNNILFKYNDLKEPTDLRLIDFQLTRTGSPVYDLSYCLYIGSEKPVLDKLDHYLKIYHDSLSFTIRQLGSDPEKIYPFRTLKEEWKIYAKFGFIMGLLIVKLKLSKQDELLDFNDLEEHGDQEISSSNIFVKSSFDEVYFLERSRDTILHLYEIQAL